MKKHLTFLVFLFVLTFNSSANHIVGGEIELIHIRGFTYDINLIQYFDEAQLGGNPILTPPDPSLLVYIYNKAADILVDTFRLQMVSMQIVQYTDQKCAIGQLQTSRIFYSTQVNLNPNLYSDTAGYYIVWERCCRNAAITNVINTTGAEVGMAYVLEFPPITKNGMPFINSSPQLFPPLSDYACVNQLFYTNFAGTDVDGDSLAYSLVAPLNSSNNFPIPTPSPKPHNPVMFAPGFSLNNIIPGSPSLQISGDGFLTINPSNAGLYVFSVLVEEFRNGIKLGQVTRDFQMLVLNGCAPPAPPVAQVRLPGETQFYNQVDTIRFTVGQRKCFDFLVIDDVGQQVQLRAEGVNFTQNISNIFSLTQGFITTSMDTLRVEVCVPDCPFVRDMPYIIDLIAADNACPLPQLDTVRLIIEVQPPPNDLPSFSISNKNLTLNENTNHTEVFNATDRDRDILNVRLDATDFIPMDYGMSLRVLNSNPGSIDFEFLWNTNCQIYDFITRNNFDLFIIVDDLDLCMNPGGDTIFYNLNVIVPPNTSPVVISTLSNPTVQVLLGNSISFNVNALDIDGDTITLEMNGNGFNPAQLGVNFQNKTGIRMLSSLFQWDLNCLNLNIITNSTFIFDFISEDKDVCRDINFDTLKISIDVIIPFNNKPTFDLISAYELNVNVPFTLDITANDLDNDFVNIDLLTGTTVPPSPSFKFNRSSGMGSATSRLEWTPECSLLGIGFAPKNYSVSFLTWDDSCPIVKYDTISINFLIKELAVSHGEFLPPNAFTPNGDTHNDTYTLNGLLDSNANLPLDNCQDQFQRIYIFNRFGKQVFQSFDRNFVWTGNGLPSGIYYYIIEYVNVHYKGTITILY